MINNDISFKSRQQVVRDAKWVAQKAHSYFPHISASMIDCKLNSDPYLEYKYRGLVASAGARQKVARMLYMADERKPFKSYCNIIDRMIDMQFGNCFETAAFAEVIAKMNGAKNVHSASLFFGPISLDHRVVFMTDKPVAKENIFRNKDALVIDPWLGIADFAGNFADTIKHSYNKIFNLMPDEKFYLWGKDRNSLTTDDFKKLRNQRKSKHEIIFKILGKEANFSAAELEKFRSRYPELVYEGRNGRKLFEILG